MDHFECFGDGLLESGDSLCWHLSFYIVFQYKAAEGLLHPQNGRPPCEGKLSQKPMKKKIEILTSQVPFSGCNAKRNRYREFLGGKLVMSRCAFRPFLLWRTKTMHHMRILKFAWVISLCKRGLCSVISVMNMMTVPQIMLSFFTEVSLLGWYDCRI